MRIWKNELGEMDRICIHCNIGSEQEGSEGSEGGGSYAATQSGDEGVQCKGIDYVDEEVESLEEEEEDERNEVFESGEEEMEVSSGEENSRSRILRERTTRGEVSELFML